MAKKLLKEDSKVRFDGKIYTIESSGITNATGIGEHGGEITIARNPRKGLVEINTGRIVRKLR